MDSHGCCGAVAEPTEQEFSNALAEATQELQVASSLHRPCQRDMDVFDRPLPVVCTPAYEKLLAGTSVCKDRL